MEQQNKTNYYSTATIWLHGFSAILIFQNIVASFMLLFLYTSANVTFDNPIAMVFLSIYAPLVLVQLYSTKKMRDGDIQGGKIALYLDSIIILVCSIDIAITGWGLSEQLIELVVAVLVFNILVVFLLSTTPAKQLREQSSDSDY